MTEHEVNETQGNRSMRVLAFAAAWLLVLTVLNLQVGGTLRGTVYYAIPVALTAWRDLRLGFALAAMGALSAWIGGSIPYPGMDEPVWIEGSWAFLKLSVVAFWTRIAQHQMSKRHST